MIKFSEENNQTEEPESALIEKKKLSSSWALTGALVMIIIVCASLYFVPSILVSNSGLCVNCHEMKPEYYTWKNSSHNKVGCSSCHMPLESGERVVRNFQSIKLVVNHLTGNYVMPIVSWQEVASENCLVCHSENRAVSPRGDILVSHANHDLKGVACVDCHNGVVHGRIAERGKTDQIKPELWSIATAISEVKQADIRPSMLTCINCHRSRDVSIPCEKCHSKIPTPESHQPFTWQISHAREAWVDVNRCTQCHGIENLENNFDKKMVAQYVRSNSFCSNCHLKTRPLSHNSSWPHDHGSIAAKESVPFCIVCHDIDKNEGNTNSNRTTTYCNKCHGNFRIKQNNVDTL